VIAPVLSAAPFYKSLESTRKDGEVYRNKGRCRARLSFSVIGVSIIPVVFFPGVLFPFPCSLDLGLVFFPFPDFSSRVSVSELDPESELSELWLCLCRADVRLGLGLGRGV